MGQSACSCRDELDSSAHWREKPGGGGGLHLGTRMSFSGGVAFSGSDVLSSLRAFTPTGGSALGIGDSALLSEAGTMGSFSATSNILRSSMSPLQITEARHLWSSCTALQSTPGDILEWTAHLWPMPLSLQPTPLNNLVLPWSLLEKQPLSPSFDD